MPTFYIYFDGICIDTLQNSTARKARNYVNRSYTNPEQCVVVEKNDDQNAAIALSKKLHVVDEAFEAEVRVVMADAELTGAARERSGKTICFSENIAKGTHGIQLLTADHEWIVLLEGATHEEARDFMRNYGLEGFQAPEDRGLTENVAMPDFKTMDSEELSSWYVKVVGYDPLEEAPDMPLDELRATCVEFCEREIADKLHPQYRSSL